jgi:hypothetical protein
VVLHEFAPELIKSERLELLHNLGGGSFRDMDVFHDVIKVSCG